MGAAIAIIVRRQKEIVEVFEGARATSPGTARYPEEIGIDQSRIFRGLINRAVVRPVGDGRYYLDEPSWVALRRQRRRGALATIIVLAALFAGAALAVASRV
ncbi:MAG TPA: hypothetical protein VGM82_07390 [Gemmatimonadaceae bacterium]|jgi:hypothetical protein